MSESVVTLVTGRDVPDREDLAESSCNEINCILGFAL